MRRQLGDSQAMTHFSKFSQLLTHSSQNFRTFTHWKNNKAICPFRRRIFFCVYIKGKPHKYGIKIFELCEAKRSYIYNLEVYTRAHPTNSEHNMAFSVVDRLCDKIKWNGHCVYMDRWFSSPKIFDHLWGCKTKAVVQ